MNHSKVIFRIKEKPKFIMKPILNLIILLIIFFIYGCATMSTFNQYAYTQATSVKVDVENLMDKATEPYTIHLTDIENVNIELQKNIEYEKHREKNNVSIQMYNILWRMINDTTTIHSGKVDFKHGFFPQWQKKNMLSTTFINNAKAQINTAFDLIAEFESKKIKSSDFSISSFLSSQK